MAKTNRSMRLAAYVCGLAIGCILIGATVARATPNFESCAQCKEHYAAIAVGPKGICENTPTKGCIEPYVTGACYNVVHEGSQGSRMSRQLRGGLRCVAQPDSTYRHVHV